MTSHLCLFSMAVIRFPPASHQNLNNRYEWSRFVSLFSDLCFSSEQSYTRRTLSTICICQWVSPLHRDVKGCPLILGRVKHIIGTFKIRAMPTILFFFECTGKKWDMWCPPPCNSSPLLARIYNMGYYVPLLWTLVMPLPETTPCWQCELSLGRRPRVRREKCM